MLTYKLIFKDSNVLRHAYYPDGKGDVGIMEFVDGKGRIIKESADNYGGIFAYHAFNIDLISER